MLWICAANDFIPVNIGNVTVMTMYILFVEYKIEVCTAALLRNQVLIITLFIGLVLQVPDISNSYIAFIFRVKRFEPLPSKYREPLSQWPSDTCWKIRMLHNNMAISRWVWQCVMCKYCGDSEIQDTKSTLWDLRFSQQCCRCLGSAVMWCCVRVSGSGPFEGM